jgi:PTS system mannose-specific IIA component
MCQGNVLVLPGQTSKRDSKESHVIGIVLISHGPLAEGLKQAAEMIVGPQERLRAVGMEPGMDLTSLRREIARAVAAVGPGGEALVLIDILGGTPANAGSQLVGEGIPVICGVNLPMLLELLTQRENAPRDELTAMALQAAKEGIINLTQKI